MPPKSEAHRQLPAYVLDSFALLVWLQDEPGADTVQSLIENGEDGRVTLFVSWMNVAEVYYIVKRRSLEPDPQLTADRTVEAIENLPIQLVPIAKTEAVAAARFKSEHLMSLADAFAAALASTANAQVVTGDPEFAPLQKGNKISILWLPTKSKAR